MVHPESYPAAFFKYMLPKPNKQIQQHQQTHRLISLILYIFVHHPSQHWVTCPAFGALRTPHTPALKCHPKHRPGVSLGRSCCAAAQAACPVQPALQGSSSLVPAQQRPSSTCSKKSLTFIIQPCTTRPCRSRAARDRPLTSSSSHHFPLHPEKKRC